MNIVAGIRKLLKSYTGTIFRYTEIVDTSVEIPDIIGRSLTEPFSYGLIFEVMGASLTDFSLYGSSPSFKKTESGERETLTEVDWMEVDEEEVDDEPAQLSATAIPGISQKDFASLEGCIQGDDNRCADTALQTVSRLKGTHLYDALKGNAETRQRIASLLSKVETERDETKPESLPDMADFLTTN